MSSPPAPESGFVLLTYHYFAHYREAILKRLLDNPRHRFLLMAGREPHPGSGIRPLEFQNEPRFLPAKNHYLGNFIWQTGLVRMAFRRDVRAIVFLGDLHLLSTWVAAFLARVMGKQVLFWTIGWHHDERGLPRLIRDSFYCLAHRLLLYGHYAQRIALAHSWPPERVYVIYNSLDYEAQRVIRESLTAEEERRAREELFPGRAQRPVLVCISRLHRGRRLDILLDAMERLKAEAFDCNLLLVGDGPERASLAARAGKAGLTVRFYGPCFEERTIAVLLSASDLTVAPGMIGLTGMQSLAYGVPIVTHGDPHNQAPEWEVLRPGVNGDTFLQGDAGDLARVIRAWAFRRREDPGLAAACIASLESRFTPAVQEAVLEAALEGKTSSSPLE